MYPSLQITLETEVGVGIRAHLPAVSRNEDERNVLTTGSVRSTSQVCVSERRRYSRAVALRASGDRVNGLDALN